MEKKIVNCPYCGSEVKDELEKVLIATAKDLGH
jgi:endogenous inhibitor of DNA gyrase (YacG/DUF329 family)